MSNIDLILKAREHGKFNEIVGKNIFIKPECLQVTGSFKFRGAWCAISQLKKENKIANGVVAYSSGNHAQALAYASLQENLNAKIIYYF